MPYLQFNDVSKRFKGDYVLRGVSFAVERGEICGFVGRNGSGKTVIFKMLSGLILPTSGSISFRGREVSGGGRFIEDAGVLIETPGFIPHYSGMKNLRVLNDLSVGKAPVSELAELMERFGLDPKSKRPVRAYSQGMKQKLGIIQSVMNSPELLILDEPMNSLDEESVASLRDFFLALNKEKGTTILMASHIKDDIQTLCGRIFTVGNHTVEEVL
jgi:ABC-2 type transport system ATP-binding protein